MYLHPFYNSSTTLIPLHTCKVDDADDADGTKAALQRYKMVDARLRRLCEKKPSGKIQVPESIHRQWLAGGAQRDELRMLLEQYDFDKEIICMT